MKAVIELDQVSVIEIINEHMKRKGILAGDIRIHVSKQYEDRPCGGSFAKFDKVTVECNLSDK